MAADREVQITVKGLRELNRAFKEIGDKVSGDGLKAAFLWIATTVASKARAGVPVGGGKTPGAAAASIQPHGTARGASISFGGQAAPYMPFLDFGGSVGRGHIHGVGFSGAIKRTWLGKPAGEGRYIYPAITSEKEHTAEAVEAAIAEIARNQDFEVS